MTSAIQYSVRNSLRMLMMVSLLTAPFGALAFAGSSESGVSRQGAGLVLYVTLQRNSMN